MEHPAKTYTDKQCITPKYFSSLSKSMSPNEYKRNICSFEKQIG